MSDHWIGFEVICGLGVRLGMQQPILAAQAVLDLKDVPIGTSIIMFSQTLATGAALFISIGQNVFQNQLVSSLRAHLVLSSGAASLKHTIDPTDLPAVLEAYSAALMSAFYVAIAMACLSLVGALAIEWKNIKGKDIDMTVAA
ncbi:hypothetical protein B0H10DRAFT_1940683 [Mycena sp. CBHHK59/15]|nr:hypothetical protein B0H10DRAFT_1940683 [Mycena sp. CBHHK59/15]